MRMTLTAEIAHTMTAASLRTWAQAWLDRLGAFLPRDEAKTPRPIRVTLSLASPDDQHETLTPSAAPSSPGQASIHLDRFTPPPRGDLARQLQTELHRAGWTVSNRAWPDFFATTADGAMCLVTARRNRGRKLRAHQRALFYALSSYGVPCYRWSPDYGFELVHRPSPQTTTPLPRM